MVRDRSSAWQRRGWSRIPSRRSRRTARRSISSNAKSPSNTACGRKGIRGSSRCGSMPRIGRGMTPGAARAAKRPSAASPISIAWKAKRSTRWPSARCMPGSSSRGISASSVTASRSSTWRFRSAISIAARSGRWSAGPTGGPCTPWKPSPATRPSATPRPIARPSRPSADCQVADPRRGAPRRGPGAGTAGQPHGRPGGLGRRRRLPADGLLLRPAPRRLPQPHGPVVRQPLRPQPGPARAASVSISTRRRSKQCIAAAGRGLQGRHRGGRPALGFALGPGPLRGYRRGLARGLRGLGHGRPGGPRLRRGVRRAAGFPRRHLPLRPGARFHLDDRRRLRPGLRPLAGDPAIGGLHSRAVAGIPRRADPRRGRPFEAASTWP